MSYARVVFVVDRHPLGHSPEIVSSYYSCIRRMMRCLQTSHSRLQWSFFLFNSHETNNILLSTTRSFVNWSESSFELFAKELVIPSVLDSSSNDWTLQENITSVLNALIDIYHWKVKDIQSDIRSLKSFIFLLSPAPLSSPALISFTSDRPPKCLCDADEVYGSSSWTRTALQNSQRNLKSTWLSNTPSSPFFHFQLLSIDFHWINTRTRDLFSTDPNVYLSSHLSVLNIDDILSLPTFIPSLTLLNRRIMNNYSNSSSHECQIDNNYMMTLYSFGPNTVSKPNTDSSTACMPQNLRIIAHLRKGADVLSLIGHNVYFVQMTHDIDKEARINPSFTLLQSQLTENTIAFYLLACFKNGRNNDIIGGVLVSISEYEKERMITTSNLKADTKIMSPIMPLGGSPLTIADIEKQSYLSAPFPSSCLGYNTIHASHEHEEVAKNYSLLVQKLRFRLYERRQLDLPQDTHESPLDERLSSLLVNPKNIVDNSEESRRFSKRQISFFDCLYNAVFNEKEKNLELLSIIKRSVTTWGVLYDLAQLEARHLARKRALRHEASPGRKTTHLKKIIQELELSDEEKRYLVNGSNLNDIKYREMQIMTIAHIESLKHHAVVTDEMMMTVYSLLDRLAVYQMDSNFFQSWLEGLRTLYANEKAVLPLILRYVGLESSPTTSPMKRDALSSTDWLDGGNSQFEMEPVEKATKNSSSKTLKRTMSSLSERLMSAFGRRLVPDLNPRRPPVADKESSNHSAKKSPRKRKSSSTNDMCIDDSKKKETRERKRKELKRESISSRAQKQTKHLTSSQRSHDGHRAQKDTHQYNHRSPSVVLATPLKSQSIPPVTESTESMAHRIRRNMTPLWKLKTSNVVEETPSKVTASPKFGSYFKAALRHLSPLKTPAETDSNSGNKKRRRLFND